MHRDDRRRHAGNVQVSDARRARTLAVALAVLLAGAALYANNVQAHACGSQADFIAQSGPLPAPVRPADCARVFQGAPDFTWPAAAGAQGYTVVITFADGRREARNTNVNWLAWDEALPAGAYTWQVVATGARALASQPRTFTVDSAAAAIAPAREADFHHAAASPATFPSDSHGSPTLAVTAPASGREIVPAPLRGAASTATAWTSPGVTSSARLQ
jgi:hypothetical protein